MILDLCLDETTRGHRAVHPAGAVGRGGGECSWQWGAGSDDQGGWGVWRSHSREYAARSAT